MAGKISRTCPRCGVSKGGYYLRSTASADSEKHQWKKHGVDVSRDKYYSR